MALKAYRIRNKSSSFLSLYCLSGSAVITGTNGDDTLIGNTAYNVINGLGGNDRINGCGGNDIISGGDGNDVLTSGPGNDQSSCGAGTDTITDFQPRFDTKNLIQRVRNASNSDISELCPHMVFGAPADRQYTRLPPLISYSNAISGIIVSDV